MLLNLYSQLRTASLDDATLVEHVYELWLNHLQQTVVVGDDNARCLRGLQLVYTLCHDAHGINVQTGVCLVEDAQLRFEHSHLEDLVALLLTTAETLVNGTIGQLGIELHNLTLLALQLQELSSVHGLQSLIFALLIDGSLHEVGHRHTRNLHRILEREEQPLVSSVLWLHLQQVLAIEVGFAFCNLVEWIAYEYSTQCRLTRTIRSHDSMCLAILDNQINAF